MPARSSRPAREWRDLAYRAIPRVVAYHGGAALWPEVESVLAHRDGWLAEHAPDLGPGKHIDPHILGIAKDLLVSHGILHQQRITLQGRDVVSFVDSSAQAERRKTEVDRLAAAKRRLYRSFLGWTSNPKRCGSIAEQHIAATLDDLAGRAIWLDPATGSGEARVISGTKISGGLDHAGHVALDPTNPRAGFIPFVIEDKNVRATIYPYHIEVWDLLCKASLLPEHVPVLIAPRIHWTTFVFFRAIGALAFPTTQQWFAPPPAIATKRFNEVTGGLSLAGAVQLQHPGRPSPALAKFFTTTLHTHSERHPDESLLAHSHTLWREASAICANPTFQTMRAHNITNRKDVFRQILDELYAENFAVDELLPRHIVYPEDGPDTENDMSWLDFVDTDDE